MNHRVKARRSKCKFGAVFTLAFLAWRVFACDSSLLPPPAKWWVLIEPAFMRPPVAIEVPGSTHSMLAAAFTCGPSVELFSNEKFDAIGVDWMVFRGQATKNASALLETLKPEIHRDSEGIIQYVALYCDRPLAVACAITPAFQQRFSDLLGPEFLVIIPNRFLVYAFPKLASNFEDYAPMIIRAYRATPYPVSLEVFEVGRSEIKAIGVFEQP